MRIQRWAFSLIVIVLAGSSVLAFARARARHSELHGLKITLLVYNYAQLPSGTMLQFENGVDQIFSRAGVEMAWIDCSPSRSNLSRPSECQQILSPAEFALRILPWNMAVRLRTRPDSLGVAWPCPVGEKCAGLADVFSDRVADQELVFMLPPSELPVLLSVVATHEIGHLLLGAGHHSLTGLMRSPLDMRSVLQEQSFFTPEQAQRIQEEVQRRMNSGESLWAAQPAK